MTPQIILGAGVLVPVVIFMVLRVNAALVFLSLCLGSVLVQFVAGDANSFLGIFSRSGHQVSASDTTIKLVLLLLPVVLTTIFMIRTVRSHGKLLLNLLPALGTGLLGVFLVVPLLPQSAQDSLTGTTAWNQLQNAQTLIVGASALICLFFLWLQRPKKSAGDDKHGKHKH